MKTLCGELQNKKTTFLQYCLRSRNAKLNETCLMYCLSTNWTVQGQHMGELTIFHYNYREMLDSSLLSASELNRPISHGSGIGSLSLWGTGRIADVMLGYSIKDFFLLNCRCYVRMQMLCQDTLLKTSPVESFIHGKAWDRSNNRLRDP